MNDSSPLPVSASDTRLSHPEAMIPVVTPELRARRQKLRKIVTWVVGSASALMCVGLICGAVRTHSRNEALAVASAEAAQTLAAAPSAVTPITDSATTTDTSAVTTAAPVTSTAPAMDKPAKKLGALHAKKHANKKSAQSKGALAHH